MADDDLCQFVDQEEIPHYDLTEPSSTYFDDPASLPNVSALASHLTDHAFQNGDDTDQDFIVALFVVTFDTRAGNIVEWRYPEVDISGVEFKALASGSHKIIKDFIYFKYGGNYGLSCFERKAVDSVSERGARMKSVGIICSKFTSLHEHMPFLEDEVRTQLDDPGNYGALLRYYHSYRKCCIKNNFVPSPTPEHIVGVEELPVLKITHPAGCFSQFLNFFGEKIFILWRLVLLQKRILFVSSPPVGIACFRVYCACLLASHSIPFGFDCGNNPLFFTNVCDLMSLHNEFKYVACTTEKIFESKSEVYDVYIDNQNMKPKPYLEQLCHIRHSDKDLYNSLIKFRSQQLYTGGEVVDDEKMYTSFFVHLNNQIFRTLIEASTTNDRYLTAEAIKSMGLDPKTDRLFLCLLVEHYGIDVNIFDAACCPFYPVQ